MSKNKDEYLIPVMCMDESCRNCPYLEIEIENSMTDDFYGGHGNYNLIYCKNVSLCRRLEQIIRTNIKE